ncbi:MAG TPA: hypothetical protein VJU86_15905 [Pyrinomonadaceae bacterium]|nr:hypothetical protein [Pyrinomonadaceae bacterium]
MADFSSRSYLLSKLLGGQKPETQATVNLVINVVTALISSLLLGFLNGYYDALYSRTGESPPSVIYLVYVFLGLVTLWQVFSFLIGVRLRNKIKARIQAEPQQESISSAANFEQRSLPKPDHESFVGSVTEDKTKILDQVRRDSQ